ncbi:MAG: protein-L-isoaspartate(D-aspartate) O-methyltransferase [Chitinophagales bacterium]|nr:protein-L-isoaspartate(D-aspartate) O-methyltransferase [Chitinophagales bacterium]MDW8274558.1 protein-L-isoaspartate(D-aspartate) O-methyltransferase [Chitinophagales bacterium]
MLERGDTYRHHGLRKALVQKLKSKDITDERVLEAIGKVPRHLFLGPDSALDHQAYEDKALPIAAGQTISQPYTVAFQTQLLEVAEGDKVLEIGTGSGYQAAILSELGAQVFTIERQKKLYDLTKPLLKELGYINIKCFFGDGFEGLPLFAPFDSIIITAAAKEIPQKLLQQLKIGGHMVIPHTEGKETIMKRLTKITDRSFEEETFHHFRFVPMLKGKVFE